MRGSLIQYQDIERRCRVLGKVVKKDLKQAGVESWQFQKKAFARQWLDAAVKRKALPFVLIRRARFDAAQRQAAAQDGDQSEVAFVLCPDAQRLLGPGQLVEGAPRQQFNAPADWLGGQYSLAQALFQRGAEERLIAFFFLMWLRRATASRAPSTCVAV